MQVASSPKKKRITNGKATKYPKIFNYHYWCKGTYEDTEDEKVIINNRNLFVEEFNIKKTSKKQPNYIYTQLRMDELGAFSHWKNEKLIYEFKKENNIPTPYKLPCKLFDHFEIYESNDLYIAIFSPYHPDKKLKECAFNMGYEIYDKVLYYDAVTFIKKVDKSIGYKNTNYIFRI
jgi:hypothetical protein